MLQLTEGEKVRDKVRDRRLKSERQRRKNFKLRVAKQLKSDRETLIIISTVMTLNVPCYTNCY